MYRPLHGGYMAHASAGATKKDLGPKRLSP